MPSLYSVATENRVEPSFPNLCAVRPHFIPATDSFFAQVPTLLPNSGSPTVMQRNLGCQEFASRRSIALPWVRQDREICSLKIRVSVVDWLRIIHGPCPHFVRVAARTKSASCRFVRPWPPVFQRLSLPLRQYLIIPRMNFA
jgi:hypothetical protein